MQGQNYQNNNYSNNNMNMGGGYGGAGANQYNNNNNNYNNMNNQGYDNLQPPRSTLNLQQKINDNFLIDQSHNNFTPGQYNNNPTQNQWDQQNNYGQGNNYATPGNNYGTSGNSMMANTGGQFNQNQGYNQFDSNRGAGGYQSAGGMGIMDNRGGMVANNNYGGQNNNQNWGQGSNNFQNNLSQGIMHPNQQMFMGLGAGNNYGGVNDYEKRELDSIMDRISTFISKTNNKNLDSFFYPFDCYIGRNIEAWELVIMFPELKPNEENSIIRSLQSPMKPGKLEFDSFVSLLQTSYNRGLQLHQMRYNSIYKDKLQNISMPLSRIEMIAKQIMDSDKLGSYKSAYQNVLFNKNSMTIDEFIQILRRAPSLQNIDKNEVQTVFNYLFINDMNFVSKIQFVQGMRNVLPDNDMLEGNQGGQYGGIGDQKNGRFNKARAGILDSSGLTPDQIKYLTQIQQHLVKYNLTLTQMLKDDGLTPDQTHINLQQLEQLGRNARVKNPLDQNQLHDMMLKLEDKERMNFIPITSLEKKMIDFSGSGALDDSSFIAKDDVSVDQSKNKILDLMRAYLVQNLPKSLDQLMLGVVKENQRFFVEIPGLLNFLTQTMKANINVDEAEAFARFYPGSYNRIDLSKIIEDIEYNEPLVIIPQDKAKVHVNEVFDLIKKFLARNEVNIVELLLDSDEDDGYLDKNELRQAFKKLGIQKLTIEQLSSFFSLFDPYKTNKLDQETIIEKFFEYANANKIKDQSNKWFTIYEKIRGFLQQKKNLSVSTIFFDENFVRSEEVEINVQDFTDILKKIVKVTELSNYATEQAFVFNILTTTGGKINFQKFADQVGYERPERKPMNINNGRYGESQKFGRGVQKFINRRQFYRTLLKSMTSKQQDQSTIFNTQIKQRMEQDLQEGDLDLTGTIHINSFTNIIIRHCPQLSQDPDLIKLVANDYMNSEGGKPNMVSYFSFMVQVTEEFSKLQFLNKIHRNFYESLEFRAENNLYTLFKQEKIDRNSLKDILVKRGITADDKEIQYVMDEYDPEKTGYIRFHDIERDYKDLTEELRQRGHSQIANLPQVLQSIKQYMDQTGQTLRQIFNKNKVGDSDQINQYQFTRILNEISQKTKLRIQEASIHKFMLELTIRDSNNVNSVSFLALSQLFNAQFKLKDDDDLRFNLFYIDKLQWHIVRVAIEKKITGFKLDEHFTYPSSTYEKFMQDLNREPLNCQQESTKQVIEEMTKKYQEGGFVNTQLMIVDLGEKMFKQEQKNQIFQDIRKQIMLKNLKIEEVFFRAIPEIQKFKIEHLTAEEFRSVFLFLEYKLTLEKVVQMLQNFFQPDEFGKYSYLDFIEEFKNSEKNNMNKKGKRYFQNIQEILKRIVTCIEQRNLKNIGSLLADQDLKSQNLIEKESFYRVIDSLQFGLGEIDIQEMIKVYRKSDNPNMIDIVRVRDDLNSLIMNQDYKIHLKSFINQVVNERIVDNIDLSPKSSKKKVQLELEAQTTFMPIIIDILSGLMARNSDITEWFARFSFIKKGSIQVKEFITALESLDVRVGDNAFYQSYFQHLCKRQEVYLGYESQTVLMEQLQQIISKDCPQTKGQMQDTILMEIAKQFTNQMTPVRDQIQIYDNQRTGIVYRTDFYGIILDNYLNLTSILTENKKKLLTQRYAPNESTLQIRYEEFIDDLKRIEQMNPKTIKICYTAQDVIKAQQQTKDAALRELEKVEQEQKIYEQQKQPDVPAQSKKNTVCTMRTLTNNGNLRVQIPPFQFEDIMLETFKKGVAVEVYFKRFSKPYNGMLILEKAEFFQVFATLNIKWAEEMKLSELFDAIDLATHGKYERKLRIEDIGEVLLVNALKTVDDFQALTIQQIYEGLKQQRMLTQLRDLFNFYNTKRDNTCSVKDISSIIVEKLKMQITESQLAITLPRYKSSYDPQRIDFTLFIKDMEYCSQGVSASLIWAIELAEDIVKGIFIKGLNGPEQLFQKFTKVNGVILYDEFRRALDDIQITIYHDDQEFRDFFTHIEQNENKGVGVQSNDFQKVGLMQLCNTVKRLCQKTMSQMYQSILERIYAESKKSNLSVTVYTIFSQLDYQKSGFVTFADFKFALENNLNCHNINLLDLQILVRRYKSNRGTGNDDMIQYDKFFADYEKIEKFGLKAGADMLRQKQQQDTLMQNKPATMPPEVQKIYSDMGNYCKKQNVMDQLCDELVRRDYERSGMLSDNLILEAFKVFKIALNKKQMNFIIYPLPFDQKGNYNYLIMIDQLFGKEQVQKVQQKSQLQGLQTTATTVNMGGQASQAREQERMSLVMSVRFKDLFELKYQTIANIAYQVSKGTYTLRDQEFQSIFKRAGIVLLSTDLDFLQRCFQTFRNPNNNCIDFRKVSQHFGISDAISLLLQEIQTQLQTKNIKVEEVLIGYHEYMTFEEMKSFLDTQKLDTKKFTQQEHKSLFDAIAERKEKMEKAIFIRVIKNEQDQQLPQDYLPYIVNELTYYICNNNVDIFKFFNFQAKKLTLQQFQTLLQQIKFVPNNAKDLPSLMMYLAMDGDNNSISIDKLLAQIRKIISNYGQQYFTGKPGAGNNSIVNRTGQQNIVPVSKQISLFNNKVNQILQKVNDHLRKNGISSQQLLASMDKNQNGQIEKSEFVTYFSVDQPIAKTSLSELELLYDALDMNKDGVLSVNEICLCIEGIQQTRQDKLNGFDQDLQKEMEREIDELFKFFDKNGDGSITLEELVLAFRSFNQQISLQEAKEMMKIADKDKSNTIDKNEFKLIMLPKFKEETLNYEQNMDDLRRLFKECDADQSNYLSKSELKVALLKLNIDLTDVQLTDLMKEMDLDDNQNIDIDEFMAFLSIADQIKFKNPQAKTNIIKIRHARKLHAIDFYNCFKNLPQCFLPSFSTEKFEKRNLHTPSHGLYPEFDSKTMSYKDLQKLDQQQKMNNPKQFITLYQPQLGCEIQIEEFSGVPLPKKEEFDWNKITHREVRAVLFDFKSSEFLSNSFIVQAQWKPEYEGKWLFNTNDNLNSAKNFLLRVDQMRLLSGPADVHLLIELVYYTLNQDALQQVTCAWGSIPVTQLDKSAKHKVTLKGGTPSSEIKMDQSELHQEKKGFTFLKKLAANLDEANLTLTVKPFSKFQENSQYLMSMLPQNCIVSKRLLSFAAAFRLYCMKKLMKYQQQMAAPQGNFVIAQFRKIFDNPDVNLILGDCWEQDVNSKQQSQQQVNFNQLMKKMEEFMIKLYSIIYSSDFQFDHVYPTRSTPIDSDLFRTREMLIKNALIPGRYKPTIDNSKKKKEKENNQNQANQQKSLQDQINSIFTDDYKPFNISEMEINISGIDQMESKQDELLKMYKEMGLIY